MPLDAPVTTATLPLSFADMKTSGLELSVPFGTMKHTGPGSTSYTSLRFFGGVRQAVGAQATVRRGRGAGEGPGGVLGARLRGGHAPGADPGHGDQPPQPLRGLREQGAAVPQGPRPLPDGP